MDLDDNDRLRHIRDAIRKIQGHFDADGPAAFARDAFAVDGHVRNLLIVGEAAYKPTETGRAAVPGVPWSQIARMRHRLVHDYFDVDVEMVYVTIRDDLPPLLEAVERVLSTRGAD